MQVKNFSKVVVVDNTPAMSLLIKDLLEGQGYEVETYDDPYVALEQMGPVDPALIISNYSMPGMNGLQFLDQVKMERPGVEGILISSTPQEVREINGKYAQVEKSNRFFEEMIDSVQIAIGKLNQLVQH